MLDLIPTQYQPAAIIIFLTLNFIYYAHNHPKVSHMLFQIFFFIYDKRLLIVKIPLIVGLYSCTMGGILGATIAFADANMILSPLYYFKNQKEKPPNTIEGHFIDWLGMTRYWIMDIILNMMLVSGIMILFT